MTLKHKGKMIYFKNPANTYRIPALLEMYPNAKFIHIYRNPYEVWSSTLKWYKSILSIYTLQTWNDEEIQTGLLGNYREMYHKLHQDRQLIPKGNIVDVMGRVSKFNDFVSLWLESMRKVEEPNLVLLRNAEIIERIKSGKIHEIPEIADEIEEFSDEIDVTTLFETETGFSEQNEIKEKIYSLIEQTSAEGKGINFERLKRDIKISDNELKTFLNDLILESRIYKSDNDNFEAF